MCVGNNLGKLLDNSDESKSCSVGNICFCRNAPVCEMSVEFGIFPFPISEISTERSVWVCVAISRLPRLMHFELSAARDLFMHCNTRFYVDARLT